MDGDAGLCGSAVIDDGEVFWMSVTRKVIRPSDSP